MPKPLQPIVLTLLLIPLPLLASAGDPQVKTDHPHYPGELSCSTFDRLFKTQAAAYQRATGRSLQSDEDKALASWYWRCLHFAHGEEGKADLFDQGFTKTDWTRDYWTGLFAHGFALCGTTHSQYAAEIEQLLGHCRGRCVGVSGHNSFEVYLQGNAYGEGKWALLDHDIATVILAEDGSRLLSIPESMKDVKRLANPTFKPERQRGWRVAGLHDDDAVGVYTEFKSAEYLSGYAGAPPMVHLRPGETLRRYLNPGLDDAKTFVFWGLNYKAARIPGPERSRTFVNQPEKMLNSKSGATHKPGQSRFANAVYTYQPDFASGSYKQAVIDESPNHVTFEFYAPYVIAATPPNDKPWGIYDPGGKNGLVIRSLAACPVSISTDQGKTWSEPAVVTSAAPIDLTDHVKGHQQYWMRFAASAESLKNADLSWRTVCQCNVAVIPRLHDGANRITFASTNRAVLSAGPNKDQAEAHVVDGKITSSSVTLELKTPRGEKPVHIHAASWNASGNPPAAVDYRIDYSTDAGKTWRPIVKDWQIVRRPPEPPDFWSQSFTWGNAPLPETNAPLRVRFTNTGGKTYRKVEAHLVYEVNNPSPTTVTFAWKDSTAQTRTASHLYAPGKEDDSWQLDAGKTVETLWVEYRVK